MLKSSTGRQEATLGTEIDVMLDTAREYCDLIDAAGTANDDWLHRLLELLPRLHAAMASLGPVSPEHSEPMRVDLDARFELFTRLRQLLGKRDAYWMQFDMAQDGQQMSGSLADDLTDIYCELKYGLQRLERRHDPDSTLRDWRHGYRVHWGQHLVDAERHLYELSARDELRP
jgi:hypothetical protein